MSSPLRSDEITSCLHRIALSRGADVALERETPSAEMLRRSDVANAHRARVQALLADLYESVTTSSEAETMAAIAQGAQLILNPRLPDDEINGRRARVQGLWRLGKRNDTFFYAPLIIKNNEVYETATTRRILEATLDNLSPLDATYREGVGPRSSASVTRNGLGLAHATRLLQSLGIGDPLGRAAMIDRNDQVWWFELADPATPRFNLDVYDREFALRHAVLQAHDAWRDGTAPFPTSPYWHRECEECPYRDHCESALTAKDDVSLVHFTTPEQQGLLHAAGIHTRRDLAALDPKAVTSAAHFTPDGEPIEMALGKSIERLADLIYRARVVTGGTFLRVVASDDVSCPTADVEVDVDMESYNDRTYLWGATVRTREPRPDATEGYHAFVTWGELTPEAEAQVFADFWAWFDNLRQRVTATGATFAAYCFWAQAENGAMDRALDTAIDGGASAADVHAFRTQKPAQWIDLHEHAKRCIQTDGPLGLKHLARAAGFAWRDENPSGEASMLWYEGAIVPGDEGLALQQRILEYNEDDCRATMALRDWLNDGAKRLPHRDEPTTPGR